MSKYSLTAIAYDKRGKILAIGKSSYVKTHPLMYTLGKKVGKPGCIYLHAEIDCLIKIKRPDRVYKLAVFRYDKSGKPKNAKPCLICQKAIEMFNIPRVEYTVD